MKKLLQKIWSGIKNLWAKTNDGVKKFIPVAVNIVEGIKNFNNSGAADFLEFVVTTAIPGSADDVLVQKARLFIKEKLPIILIELKIINSIADLTDDNEKLKAILNELNLSSVNGIIFKGVAGKALELMADGEFTFDDACDLTSYYFRELRNGTSQGGDTTT